MGKLDHWFKGPRSSRPGRRQGDISVGRPQPTPLESGDASNSSTLGDMPILKGSSAYQPVHRNDSSILEKNAVSANKQPAARARDLWQAAFDKLDKDEKPLLRSSVIEEFRIVEFVEEVINLTK